MKTLEMYIKEYGPEDGPKRFRKNEYGKKYQKEHPAQHVRAMQKFRSLGKDVYSQPLVTAKMVVHKREHNFCEICGKTKNLECHHIVPITMNNYKIYREDPNIITVCESCHLNIHNKLLSIPEKNIDRLTDYLANYLSIHIEEELNESSNSEV